MNEEVDEKEDEEVDEEEEEEEEVGELESGVSFKCQCTQKGFQQESQREH